LQRSLESMGRGFGASARIARSLLGKIDGDGLAVAMTHVPAFDAVDREVIAAGEGTGHLDGTLGTLAARYDAQASARARLLGDLAYPIFLLHFGAIALAAPLAVSSGVRPAIVEALYFLSFFYGAAFLGWLGLLAVCRLARTSPGFDGLLFRFPGRPLALANFCQISALLIGAGAGILSSLSRAAACSGSAALKAAIGGACNDVQNGRSLPESVSRIRLLGHDLSEALSVGAETGRLDEELRRMAILYRDRFELALKHFSNWLPKLIYLGITLGLAYRIISFAQDSLGGVKELLDQ